MAPDPEFIVRQFSNAHDNLFFKVQIAYLGNLLKFVPLRIEGLDFLQSDGRVVNNSDRYFGFSVNNFFIKDSVLANHGADQ